MQTLQGMNARRPRLVQGKINQKRFCFFHYAVPRLFMQRKMQGQDRLAGKKRMGKT